jgi:hypothetical protein
MKPRARKVVVTNAPQVRLSETITGDGSGRLQETIRETEAALAVLGRIRAFVPHILATAGATVDRDGGWSEVLDHLGHTEQAQIELNDLGRFEEDLKRLAPSDDGRQTFTSCFYGYAFEQARMAYLLGVAVGQHLGPHAFTSSTLMEDPPNVGGAE